MSTKFKQFVDKSSIFKKRSRYAQGGVSEIRGKFLGWWERDPTIAMESDDDVYINGLPAVYEGRPDLLAQDLYGDAGLEWIILQSNLIVDLNEEFVTGVKLRVPSNHRVHSVILAKPTNSY